MFFYSSKADELLKLQDQYLQHIQQKLAHTRVVQRPDTGAIVGLELILPGQEQQQSPPEHAFVPTVDELFEYTYHPLLYTSIERLQHECLQKAEEKMAVAQQTHELVDAQVQRLDRDLAAMEALLQVRRIIIIILVIRVVVFSLEQTFFVRRMRTRRIRSPARLFLPFVCMFVCVCMFIYIPERVTLSTLLDLTTYIYSSMMIMIQI